MRESTSAMLPSPVLDNVFYLEQGLDLLAGLDQEGLVATDPKAGGGSTGAHMRHCIEFYRCLLRGVESGRIDYDARERDGHIENDAEKAASAIRELVHGFSRMSAEKLRQSVQVKHDGEGAGAWVSSSVGRELFFLMSHTVHHYALIAILLRYRGHELPEGFGVAPSTLRYQEEVSKCVR